MRSAPKSIRAEKQDQEDSPVTAREGDFKFAPNLGDIAFWRRLFDILDDSISIHSVTGNILFANKKLLETYGRSASEIIGTNCSQWFHTGEFSCPHELVVDTNAGAEGETTLDNGMRVFKVNVMPIEGGNGKAGGYIRLMRDITYKRRTEEQLLKAEHLATLSQMISGLAHDLGTPLNIISGYSEYLLMRTKPEAQGHKELSTILQQTRRIANFIRHMLDLARPVQGRNEPIELKNFISESVDLMSHHFRKADVKVTIEERNPQELLYGNAATLKRAVFNLLLTALGEIGQGGRLEISIDESPYNPDFIMVMFGAMGKDGAGQDLSAVFGGLLSKNEGEISKGVGLSLAREVLTEFGAEVDSFAVAERGVPLVVFLPKKAGGQFTAPSKVG